MKTQTDGRPECRPLETGLLDHLTRTERYVRKARKYWDASSVARCMECAEALRRATKEMEAACQAAAKGLRSTGVKTRLERLRGEVDALAGLVDAAIAFSRGLALAASGATAGSALGLGQESTG